MYSIKQIILVLVLVLAGCTTNEIGPEPESIVANTESRVLILRVNKYSGPLVSFIFDDGWGSDYTVVRPIFKQRNLRCGFAIVKNLVGREDRLSVAQVKKMSEENFEILAHSVGHFKMSKDNLPLERIQWEVQNSTAFLDSLGCEVRGWVTPMSIMNDKYLPSLNSLAYSFTKSNGFDPIDETNVHKLTRFGLESTSLQKAITAVSKAYREQKPIVFYAHNILKGTQEEGDLISLIEYCSKNNYQIVTPAKLVEHYYPQCQLSLNP